MIDRSSGLLGWIFDAPFILLSASVAIDAIALASEKNTAIELADHAPVSVLQVLELEIPGSLVGKCLERDVIPEVQQRVVGLWRFDVSMVPSLDTTAKLPE